MGGLTDVKAKFIIISFFLRNTTMNRHCLWRSTPEPNRSNFIFRVRKWLNPGIWISSNVDQPRVHHVQYPFLAILPIAVQKGKVNYVIETVQRRHDRLGLWR
jgi:hypothetical protein